MSGANREHSQSGLINLGVLVSLLFFIGGMGLGDLVRWLILCVLVLLGEPPEAVMALG